MLKKKQKIGEQTQEQTKKIPEQNVIYKADTFWIANGL